jgi:hypothetical protein
MSSPAVADAARVRPPQTGNVNEAALAAATSSAALDLFAGQGADVKALWVSLACTNPFNYLVGESGVAAPSSQPYFANGSVQQFRATRATQRYMRVIIPLGGNYQWWVSGP